MQDGVYLPKQAKSYSFKYEAMKLKDNHEELPFWLNYNCLIILEATSFLSKQATDFLIAIAEPISRPSRIHEYKITAYSLYAAASVGLTTEDILITLEKFSKNYIPTSVKNFIEACTLSYGKIKLVLKNNNYWIEAQSFQILRILLKDPLINSCRVHTEEESSDDEPVITFQVDSKKLEDLKKRCIEIDYPLIEEYDFRNDSRIRTLEMDLRSFVNIRTYQEISLNKMFGNGRARSGIIVLPCGSGKTLVGITAICTIKKPCLILCTSAVSVEQWKEQLNTYTTLSDKNIVRFTSDKKDEWTEQSGVLITTYTMISYSGKRSYEAQKIMDVIKKLEWGLLVLDEVHVVPATMFRRVVSSVSHHCKLGLTATLLREDDKIEDLNFLIGPKLYEADWQDLSHQGHIATVVCVEIWCKMTAEFYREYLTQSVNRRRLIGIMNPHKFQACEYLIKQHEKKGDKIIVFSDNVFALKSYALKLGKPYIYGPTGQAERMRILKQFQTNPNINTIFLSKVGDTSIDLPEATCIIQISSHFGSRRQEAQRLGRILRAKRRNDPGFKVHFYTLVSKDTDEMFYSNKRQQFLIDQGYSFKIHSNLKEVEESENRILKRKNEQKELLASILLAAEIELEVEDSEDKIITETTIKKHTGIKEQAYIENNKKRHILFKNEEKKLKKKKF